MPPSTDWIVRPLGEVLASAKPGFAGKPVSSERAVAQLRPQNVTPSGWLNTSSVKSVSPPSESEAFGIQHDDILLINTSSLGHVGKSAWVAEPFEGVYSNHVTRIRVRAGSVLAEFVAEWLHYLFLDGFFRRHAHQWINQAGVNLDQLRRIPLAYPATERQQRHIAEVGGVRRALLKATEGHQCQSYALAQEWFDERVSALCSAAPMAALSDVAQVSGGLAVGPKRSAGSGTQIPYLRVANVYRGRLQLDEVKSLRASPREVATRLLQPSDLLMVEGHADAAEVGRAAMWDGSIDQCVHQNHLFRIRASENEVTSATLLLILNSTLLRSRIRSTVQASGGLHTLRITAVRNLDVPIPNLQAQEALENVVRMQQELATALSTQRRRAEELAWALLLELFAGGRRAITAWSGAPETPRSRRTVATPDSALTFPNLWMRLSSQQQAIWVAAAQTEGAFIASQLETGEVGESRSGEDWAVTATLELLSELGLVERAGFERPLQWRFSAEAQAAGEDGGS